MRVAFAVECECEFGGDVQRLCRVGCGCIQSTPGAGVSQHL